MCTFLELIQWIKMLRFCQICSTDQHSNLYILEIYSWARAKLFINKSADFFRHVSAHLAKPQRENPSTYSKKKGAPLCVILADANIVSVLLL